MSDIVAQFGLDDRDFQRGLDRSERQAVTSAERIFQRTSRIATREAEVQQGLASKIQNAYTKGWAAIAKSITSVAAAGALVARSVSEYGERFSYARGQAEQLSRSVDRFKTSLGRDLAGAGGGDMLSGIIDRAGKAREVLSDLVAVSANFYSFGLLGNSPDEISEINAARKRLEAQDAEAARTAIYSDQNLGLKIRAAQAAGDEQGAAELRVQQRSREASQRLAGMNLDSNMRDDLRARELEIIRREEFGKLDSGRAGRIAEADAADQKRYMANQTAVDREREVQNARRARELRAAGQYDAAAGLEAEFTIQERASQMRSKGADPAFVQRFVEAERQAAGQGIQEQRAEREQRKREAAESVELMTKSLRVDTLRMQGKTKEAEALRMTLEAERQIAEIRANDLLTIEQKNMAVSALQSHLGVGIEALQQLKGGSSIRSLVSGLGSDANLRRQTLGVGGNLAGQQLAEARKTNQILEAIEEKTGMYA